MGPLGLITGLMAALSHAGGFQAQNSTSFEGCYALTLTTQTGDVIFSRSPDSIRLEARPDSGVAERHVVTYIGRRSRSPFNQAFLKDLRWRSASGDSVVIYAPLGMWMIQVRFVVDSTGRVHGRYFVYGDVVSSNDERRIGILLSGNRIPCPTR